MGINIEMSSGGRIKAAGLPFTMFTDPAEAYLSHPNVANAANLTDAYANLRKAPPQLVRDRFFPRDPTISGSFKSGAALPRTSLTNHQGVGQFLVHHAGGFEQKNAPLRIDIVSQTGFAILEAHLENQMSKHEYVYTMRKLIQEVRKHFAIGNLHEAQLAYEKLIIAGAQRGIQVQRKADVGREGLFFIHPSIPCVPAEIDSRTRDKLRQKGSELIEKMGEVARQKRDEFAFSQGIVPPEIKENFLPLYFQIDFLVKKDKSFNISDVGLPDVGFFLSDINPQGNQTVKEAQKTVTERLNDVMESVNRKTLEHKTKIVCFITRKAVIENQEDTLEIKEIKVLRDSLEALGLSSRVISDDQASEMTDDELGILMNVDTSSLGFQKLLKKRIYDESVPIYPDPFLLLAQNELTEHPQVTISKEGLDLFKSVFTVTEKASNVEKAAVQLAAIDQLIRRTGIPDGCDILHMIIPGQPTSVAFYRHDIKGLQIALNEAKNASRVMLRGIPVNPENAVLFDPDGKPVYTTFRYMFNQ